jgi:uncharacterized protein
MDPLIVIFGLGIGLLVGATGLGGASLMTPLLIIVFGIKPVTAIGTDLAYGAVTKTVGGWRHFRQGTVHLGISWWLAFGSIPGALIGVWGLGQLKAAHGDGFDKVIMLVIAGVVLIVGVIALGRVLFRKNASFDESESPEMTRRRKVQAVTVGLPVGIVIGATSVGSGALIAIVLIFLYKLTPRRVVGTDVFHAALLLWVAAGAHIVSGNVDFLLAANILIGSVPGVWIGAKLAMKIPERALRPTLGIVLVAVGIGLISKSGLVRIPAEVLLGVPLTLGLITWFVHSARVREVAPEGA